MVNDEEISSELITSFYTPTPSKIIYTESDSQVYIDCDSQIWLDLLKEVEIIYKEKMKKKPFVFDTKSKKTFKEQLTYAIYTCWKQAVENMKLEEVEESFGKRRLPFQKLIFDYAKELIDQIVAINSISILCEKHGCIFLRYLDQSKYPAGSLTGKLCFGITYRWAEKLYTAPPKDMEDLGLSFKKYKDFLNAIRQEKFPSEFYALRSYRGDSMIDNRVIQYKRNSGWIIRKLASSPLHQSSSQCSGRALGIAALKFLDAQYLKKKEPIIIITAHLESKSKDFSHLIGLARIQHRSKVYYRLCDSEYGEFEIHSAEQFPEWIEQYFQFKGYNKTSSDSGFLLRRIDGILNNMDIIVKDFPFQPSKLYSDLLMSGLNLYSSTSPENLFSNTEGSLSPSAITPNFSKYQADQKKQEEQKKSSAKDADGCLQRHVSTPVKNSPINMRFPFSPLTLSSDVEKSISENAILSDFLRYQAEQKQKEKQPQSSAKNVSHFVQQQKDSPIKTPSKGRIS